MKTITTISGNFWDELSFQEYGTEYALDQLIEANIDSRYIVRFEAGEVLNVPDFVPTPIAGLPPWRRVLRRL